MRKIIRMLLEGLIASLQAEHDRCERYMNSAEIGSELWTSYKGQAMGFEFAINLVNGKIDDLQD